MGPFRKTLAQHQWLTPLLATLFATQATSATEKPEHFQIQLENPNHWLTIATSKTPQKQTVKIKLSNLFVFKKWISEKRRHESILEVDCEIDNQTNNTIKNFSGLAIFFGQKQQVSTLLRLLRGNTIPPKTTSKPITSVCKLYDKEGSGLTYQEAKTHFNNKKIPLSLQKKEQRPIALVQDKAEKPFIPAEIAPKTQNENQLHNDEKEPHPPNHNTQPITSQAHENRSPLKNLIIVAAITCTSSGVCTYQLAKPQPQKKENETIDN